MLTICTNGNDIIIDNDDRSIKFISKDTNDSFDYLVELLKSRDCYDITNTDIFHHLSIAIEKHLEL